MACGLYDGRDIFFYFKLSALLKQALSRKYSGFRFYAHNGGKFDFLPIIETLSAWKIPYAITQIAGRIAQLRVFYQGHRYTFCDSICLLPQSLKKLSVAFEVDHQKQDFDFEKEVFDLNNPTHKSYLNSDLRGLFEILTKFFNTPMVRDVKPKLTLAATALAVHRTTLKASIRRSPLEIQNFVRSGYFGGRVEIFKHEGFNLNYYDVNSIYPYCMRNFPIPIEYIGESENYRQFGFHKVSVSVPHDIEIPILPVKVKDKLIFPTGVFTGTFFSEELKLAVSMGCKITKFWYGECFSKEFGFFDEYIDYFHKLKTENEGNALRFIAKLFLNGLYGKYGQRETMQFMQTMNFNSEIEGEVWGSEEIFNKFGLVVGEIKRRSPHMLCHIAAAITSYARGHLYRSALYPNRNSLYYCDTDAIPTQNRLETVSALGALKLEDTWDYAYFRLPKTYATIKEGKLKFKCKGFPEEYLKGLTMEQFKSESLASSRIKIMGFRSAIKKFNKSFVASEFKKSLVQVYDKRKTLPCGVNTRAWNLTKEGILI